MSSRIAALALLVGSLGLRRARWCSPRRTCARPSCRASHARMPVATGRCHRPGSAAAGLRWSTPFAFLAEFAAVAGSPIAVPGHARRAADCWPAAWWPRWVGCGSGRPVACRTPLRASCWPAWSEWFAHSLAGRRRERPVSADIFGGQPSDPDLLAELYDLEHDEVARICLLPGDGAPVGGCGPGPRLRVRSPLRQPDQRRGAPAAGTWTARRRSCGARSGASQEDERLRRAAADGTAATGARRRSSAAPRHVPIKACASAWSWRPASFRTWTDPRSALALLDGVARAAGAVGRAGPR